MRVRVFSIRKKIVVYEIVSYCEVGGVSIFE